LDRPQRPLFRAGVGGVDKGLREIDLAAVPQIFGEPLEQPIEAAAPLPLLKPAMAGLIRRIAARQIVPRGAGAQHPEHAVQHGPRIGPRASATIGPHAWPKGRFEYRPLGVGEVHAPRYDASPLVVTPMLKGL